MYCAKGTEILQIAYLRPGDWNFLHNLTTCGDPAQLNNFLQCHYHLIQCVKIKLYIHVYPSFYMPCSLAKKQLELLVHFSGCLQNPDRLVMNTR